MSVLKTKKILVFFRNTFSFPFFFFFFSAEHSKFSIVLESCFKHFALRLYLSGYHLLRVLILLFSSMHILYI